MFWFLTLSTFAMDLETAVEKARLGTESVAQQISVKTQADETVNQAWGSILPTLSFNVIRTQQDNSGLPSLASYTQTGKFTLSETLFAGTTEYFGMGAAKANVRVQDFKRSQVELTLISNVSSAYFGVLQAEQSLQNVKESIAVIRKRLSELNDRARIGRSRKGEVLSAQAQLAALEAQEELALSTVQSARETFTKNTGLPSDTEVQKELSKYLPPKEIPPFSKYEKALPDKPDLRAADETVDYSEKLLSVAKGGHIPTLALGANYYVNRENSAFAGSNWDVTLTLTVPLFAGGITQSKVRSAAETWKQAVYSQATLQRESETKLRTSYASVSSGLKRLALLEQALVIAQANYQEQARDYSHGLVTNLEVLSATQSQLDARQQRDQARTTLCNDWIQLRVAAGENPLGARR